MKMKKSLRRRSAVRELLLNFELRPFCEEPQSSASSGWLALSRPGVAYWPIYATPRLLPGERR
ncbi:hypothetical protein [Methylocystis bryophila]|uniref:Uncharacterized protein n=1 Tax=Methylocystis bryophila TaxID=655015 RepID=A0A1W6MWU8_9HYPH|nr:hypothetical protein [Methylocystis bryophila]ARN82057.1 hypothetical protein B1812_14315 [Methylocystis bryophila]BDV38179.1 hypothetical protein DSM21852_14320 [Methylocystis bryophila]